LTDDIVTRLRVSYYASRTCFELLPDEIHDMKEAAAEIERLRADRDRWELAARMAYHYPTHNIHVGPLSCEQCADAFRAYKEALGDTHVG